MVTITMDLKPMKIFMGFSWHFHGIFTAFSWLNLHGFFMNMKYHEYPMKNP